jgi:hypothetical protein
MELRPMGCSNDGRIRAILLSTQRTGSSFLIDCLRSHPDIEAMGELLIGAPYSPVPFTKGSYRTLAKISRFVRVGAWMPGRHMEVFFNGGHARVRLFKAMYNHISNPITLGYLRKRTDIRILHLRRHNLLKMYVSRMLMGAGTRVVSVKPVAAARVHIDPAKALASMRTARRKHQHFEDVFRAHARLHLKYEDLIVEQSINPVVSESMCDFLGIARSPMSSRLMKINREPLANIVVNYEEVVRAISRTEFAELLD